MAANHETAARSHVVLSIVGSVVSRGCKSCAVCSSEGKCLWKWDVEANELELSLGTACCCL